MTEATGAQTARRGMECSRWREIQREIRAAGQEGPIVLFNTNLRSIWYPRRFAHATFVLGVAYRPRRYITAAARD
jgi:hypothetical protein